MIHERSNMKHITRLVSKLITDHYQANFRIGQKIYMEACHSGLASGMQNVVLTFQTPREITDIKYWVNIVPVGDLTPLSATTYLGTMTINFVPLHILDRNFKRYNVVASHGEPPSFPLWQSKHWFLLLKAGMQVGLTSRQDHFLV